VLSVDQLSFRYTKVPVLDGLSFAVAQPQVVALIGPNGAGKSTLTQVLAGHLRDYTGQCRVGDLSPQYASPNQLARVVAHLPQQMPRDIPYTVKQVVLTGRHPYSSGLEDSAEDLKVAEQAMADSAVQHLAQRRFTQLSGGEQQRVLLAAAIAQQPRVLLLDEPAAHLDPEHQVTLWSLLRRQCEQKEARTALVVTHNLPLAAQFADRVLILHKGKLVADAAPCEAMNPDLLRQVFGIAFDWYRNAAGKTMLGYG
jgi:iron complex transport system ATP-binding protein